MTTRARRAGPLLLAVPASIIALIIVGFVAAVNVPEIERRTDNSWHYERVTLTQCSAISQQQYQGISFICTFATVPPIPFAIEPQLDVTASGRAAPTSTTEWIHVVDGRIAGTYGPEVSLWSLAFLIIPLLMLAAYVRSVRAAHRAGRRWRDPRGN